MKTYKLRINDNPYEVSIVSVEGNNAKVEVNGETYDVVIEEGIRIPKKFTPPKRKTETTSTTTVANTQQPPTTETKPVAQSTTTGTITPVKSPLPGVVLEIFVKPGDTVKLGQKVILLEAMKMENAINAEKDGIVKEVKVSKGSSVMEGDVLILIEG